MIEDVTVKCDACGAREVVKPMVATMDVLGAEQRLMVTVRVPKGWRGSYGASGRGCFAACPSCKGRKIRFDDSGRGVIVDHGGFLDD